ncbi:MAG TPA: hypothetical protein VJ843_00380 [Candidatus Saccharimonadales bacterium]|nr:hypothetical protein [Candidatus Saccharimonadales bacterium]
MDWKTGLTLAVSILIAAVGFVAKYINDVKIAQRKDRLERVSRQLKEFYGPLYALIEASEIAWRGFRRKYRPNQSYWRSEPYPNEEEAAAYRLWMREVFMPLNLRMEKVIVENADLLDDEKMPACLLTVCAHVSAYKTVLKRWESGDYSEHLSIVNFPGKELREYIERVYSRLKNEQEKLVGRLRGKDAA